MFISRIVEGEGVRCTTLNKLSPWKKCSECSRSSTTSRMHHPQIVVKHLTCSACNMRFLQRGSGWFEAPPQHWFEAPRAASESDGRAAASPVGPDPPGAVFVSQRGQIRPVGSFGRVLRVRSALGTAAERGAEAQADRASQQHKHDAVGRSLRGVTNTLQNQYKIQLFLYKKNEFLMVYLISTCIHYYN